VNKIYNWLIIIGSIQLVLIVISLFFLTPKKIFKKTAKEYFDLFKKNAIPISIILAVVLFHLIEVKTIDVITTEIVGTDFAPTIKSIEGNFVASFSQYWTPVLVSFFVLIYIAVYPFTLWFSPLYYIIADEKQAMKTLAYGLLIIYIVALPFYLFLPVTNVYVFNNLGSALENTIPTVENFFYAVTTENNCLPSLHTAMTILIAYSMSLTKNKKLTYLTYFTMITVIIAIMYLAIHWIIDIIAGASLAIAVIFILRYTMKKKEWSKTK
jgi:membrane-associated phospholipid phosphatase